MLNLTHARSRPPNHSCRCNRLFGTITLFLSASGHRSQGQSCRRHFSSVVHHRSASAVPDTPVASLSYTRLIGLQPTNKQPRHPDQRRRQALGPVFHMHLDANLTQGVLLRHCAAGRQGSAACSRVGMRMKRGTAPGRARHALVVRVN